LTTFLPLCYTHGVISPDIEGQIAAISRGVSDIIPLAELKTKLARSAKENRPLRVKLGLDPTAPDIHLGFAVVLRKLRLFQDLGHQVVIIIGDYTALIGDPSGRSTTRPMLTTEEIARNAQTYVEQLSRILDRDKMEVRFNSEWLGKLSFAELVGLASHMTVAQVMQREDFASRYAQGQPISLHELLYPLAQAFDSVAIHADIEMGGQDQTFNVLAGRHLQEQMGQERQIAIFMPILVGLDGVKKMSKSLGNYVGIAEPPGEMFGKLLSIRDEIMREYFVLCTDVPLPEIDSLLLEATEGRVNPKEIKKRLAREIVTLYHGPDAALAADEEFERIHGRGATRDAVPDDTPEVPISTENMDADGHIRVTHLLVAAGMAPSAGEAKRLIQQGGVSLDGQKITDVNQTVLVQNGQVLRVGKHRFARLLPPAGA
jgi:tyrosyl-tRNA synthetase